VCGGVLYGRVNYRLAEVNMVELDGAGRRVPPSERLLLLAILDDELGTNSSAPGGDSVWDLVDDM